MLKDSEGNTLTHNYRPIQPIGDRIVWFISNDFVINGSSISSDKKYDELSEDINSQLKNAGMQIEIKVILIISLSTVMLLNTFMPYLLVNRI